MTLGPASFGKAGIGFALAWIVFGLLLLSAHEQGPSFSGWLSLLFGTGLLWWESNWTVFSEAEISSVRLFRKRSICRDEISHWTVGTQGTRANQVFPVVVSVSGSRLKLAGRRRSTVERVAELAPYFEGIPYRLPEEAALRSSPGHPDVAGL